MAYRIRPELAFCLIGSSSVFLDLASNRYFQLNSELTMAFRDFLEQETGPSEAMHALCRAGVLEEAAAFIPWKPDLPVTPRCSSLAIQQATCSCLDVGLVLLMQRGVSKRLNAQSLLSELADLKDLRCDLAIWPPAVESSAGSIIRAFERSKLFKSQTDLCLPRSIALVRSLAKVRVGANLVVGVKLFPFAAHAWVQASDDILNDSFEEVAKYTPIFAL